MDAGPKAYPALFPLVQAREAETVPFFQAEIAASVWHHPVESEEAKDRLAERQARAAVALVRLGRANEVWTLLRHSADPRLRSFMINWLNPLGADPNLIADRARASRQRRAQGEHRSRRAGLKPRPDNRTLGAGLQTPPDQRPQVSALPATHGHHPLPPRNLDPPGPDPGAGHLRHDRPLPW